MPHEPVKFLVVDDVPENLAAAEALLRRDGLEIHTARTGTDGLELLLQHDFALALLDVQLPDMDGFELAEFMRGTERTRRVPIIFLTAVATDERRRFRGYESGAVDYLIKPVDPHVLRRKAEVFFELDRQRRDLVRQRDDLRDSEQRFRRSVMQAPVPMMLFDDADQILALNDEWVGLTGYSQGELGSVSDWMSRAFAKHEKAAPPLTAGITPASGRSRGEVEVETKAGDTRTWDLVVSAVGRTEENHKLFLAVAHDVTERKRAERTQQLLMGELNHRVKNTLATVQAIAQQTLRRSSDPERFVSSFSGRLQSLSRAHSMLSNESWKGADIRDLVEDQLSLGSIDRRRTTVEGPNVRLKPQHALHVALILHELATNAIKYGPLSTGEGGISISWTSDGNSLSLRWQETGGPAVAVPEKRGFGTTLIEQTCKGGGGSAEVEFPSQGVRWLIQMPLSQHELASPDAVSTGTIRVRENPADAFGSLAGKRILVVEDEPLVALDLVSGLENAGAHIAGPVSTPAEAIDLIRAVRLDAALLDGNLHGRPVDAVANELSHTGIPFVFVTGYGPESLPAHFRSRRILSKPFTEAQLIDVTRDLVDNPSQSVDPPAVT